MEAKELMVGDLIYNHRNWVCQVTDINKEHVTVIAQQYGETPYRWEDIYPIPLTTEILEKNGFIKSAPLTPPGIHTKCYECDNPKEKYHLTIADYNKYKRLLLNIDSKDSECF